MEGRMAYDKGMFKTVQSALVAPLPPGLRLLPGYPNNEFPAYLSQGKLRVFVLIENGDPEGATSVDKVDLPEGWELSVQLPLEVKGPGKATLQFQRPAEGVTEVPSLPFTIHTKSAKTPALEGKIKYRKAGSAPIAAPAPAPPPKQ